MSSEADVKLLHSLAGLVQKITQDCKVGLPLFDELLIKTTKLQTQLLSTASSLSSFLETFQKLADTASNTKGTSTDIGICLTRIVLRHRALESHLRTLTRALSECFIFPVQSKLEEWRNQVKQIDRDHTRDFKKMRSLVKKKSEQIKKLRKKMSKEKGGNGQLATTCDQQIQEFNKCINTFEEKEKKVVQKICSQERSHYSVLAASFKPIIGEEYSMLQEIEQLTEVMDKLNRILSEPRRFDTNNDDIVSLLQTSKDKFCYSSPPSSPTGSNVSSRRGSIHSNSSSRASSASRSSYHETCSIRSDTYPSDTEMTGRESIISSRSHDSGYPETYFSIDQTLFINEDDLDISRSKEVKMRSRPAGQAGQPGQTENKMNGRPPLPRKPKPVVPDRSSSLENKGGKSPQRPSSLTTSTLVRSYSPFFNSSAPGSRLETPPPGARSLDNSQSASGPRSLELGAGRGGSVEVTPAGARSVELPPAAVRSVEPPHYGVPNNIPVTTGVQGMVNSQSQYSVPKNVPNQVLPNYALEKLDMVLPLPIYMNTQLMSSSGTGSTRPTSAIETTYTRYSSAPNTPRDKGFMSSGFQHEKSGSSCSEPPTASIMSSTSNPFTFRTGSPSTSSSSSIKSPFSQHPAATSGQPVYTCPTPGVKPVVAQASGGLHYQNVTDSQTVNLKIQENVADRTFKEGSVERPGDLKQINMERSLHIQESIDTEEDLVTPTIEQLSILDEKVSSSGCTRPLDTSSGSGSMGSSSGYGSTGFDPSILEDNPDLPCDTGSMDSGGDSNQKMKLTIVEPDHKSTVEPKDIALRITLDTSPSLSTRSSKFTGGTQSQSGISKFSTQNHTKGLVNKTCSPLSFSSSRAASSNLPTPASSNYGSNCANYSTNSTFTPASSTATNTHNSAKPNQMPKDATQKMAPKSIVLTSSSKMECEKARMSLADGATLKACGMSGGEDLRGTETSTGTLKRSQSVGTTPISVFDRHHPVRQSISGDHPKYKESNGGAGGAKSRGLKGFAEKSFIPKFYTSSSSRNGARASSEPQSESRLPRLNGISKSNIGAGSKSKQTIYSV